MATISERAFLYGCCLESRDISIQKSCQVLHLNFSHWINNLEKSVLEEEVKQYSSVSLTLSSIQPLAKEEIFWISEVIGPRLTEIAVVDCNFLNDKVFKKLTECSKKIESIRLIRNKWVNDNLVETLVMRLCKHLVNLEFENVKVSDVSMFQVGRLCKGLRSLSIIHCKGITDDGLIELAKRVNLSSIRLCHNNSVTDKGVVKLVGSSKRLTDIDLLDCPKVSNKAIQSLYDTKLAWGNTKSGKAAHLESLRVRGNANLKSDVFLHVGMNSFGLLELDLRDCPELDLLDVCLNLDSLESLDALLIGPCALEQNPSDLVEAISALAPSLSKLHLHEMECFSDAHVAQIVQNSLALSEFFVSDANVGVKTVEALCSYVANITQLSIFGSKLLKDKEVRCLAASMPMLKQLSIVGCNGITGQAFTRCAHLKMTLLDASMCLTGLTGSLLTCFSNSPLQKVILNDNSLTFQHGENQSYWKSMHIRAKVSVREIYLRNNADLTVQDVLDILNHFPFCEILDLTGCNHLQTSLNSLDHCNPSLRLMSGKNFFGYKSSEQSLSKCRKAQDILMQTLKEKSKRIIYRAYLKYLENCQKIVEEKERANNAIKEYLVTKIQSVVRMWMVRRVVWPRVLSGRLIVLHSRRYLHRCNFYKVIEADKYRKHQVKANVWVRMKAFAKASKEKMEERLNSHVIPRYLKRIKTRYFRLMVEKQHLQRDLKILECAEAIWEWNFLSKIVRAWKSIRSGSTHLKRQQLLVKIFMCIVPLSHQNSFRQLSNYHTCLPFVEKRLLVPAWIAFMDDYVRTKKAELLIPKAIEHHLKALFSREVSKTYQALSDYAKERRWKKAQRVKGDLQFDLWSRMLGVRYFSKARLAQIRYRHGIEIALRFRKRFPLRNVTDKFHRIILQSKLERRGFSVARHMFMNNQFQKVKQNVIRVKKWNTMCALAIFTYEENTKQWVVKGWKRVTEYCKNLDEFMWGKYNKRLMKKAFETLHSDLIEAKRYRASLGEDVGEEFEDELVPPVVDKATGEVVPTNELTLEQKQEREAEKARIKAEKKKAYDLMIKRMTLLQGLIRRFVARRRFRTLRMEQEWATGVLQRFARSLLAYKRLSVLKKRWFLIERKREEAELDAMRDEEVETRYFNMHLQAIIDIQRCFRGWQGRDSANTIAGSYAKIRNAIFYEKMADIRAAYERELRAEAAKEMLRHRSATLIQSIVRGTQARERVRLLREELKYDGCATLIQRIYRGRLAKLHLDALRRYAAHMDRYHAARRQRGLMLRLFGSKKRKKQLKLSKLLVTLGLEPTSFNYRVSEVFRETVKDFHDFVDVVKREYEIMRETRGKKVLVLNARRKYFIMKGVALHQNDAVIIIDPKHKFYGYTGVICRVDTTIPGDPLFEIKLDNLSRQTFVHMTTDGLSTYMYHPHPAARTTAKPSVKPFLNNRPPEIFKGSMEPEFSKDRIAAAWKIQCAFRMYSARRRVSRRRYEIWTRRADTQRSLISQLQETNTLTTQAYYLTGILKLRPLYNIKFDELRHTIESARLKASSRRKAIIPAIRNEEKEKYTERIRFLEAAFKNPKKKAFIRGWQKFNRWRNFSMLCIQSAGFVARGLSSLRSVVGGTRGIHNISRASKSKVVGTSQTIFPEFHGSPHVRFSVVSMYQGEWKGVPYFGKMKPHGEGILLFYDGWGFAREDKVLHLNIIRASHLNAADLSTSDPYCDIYCNGRNLQTTVIWSNLNPVWKENFQIDVTNPDAVLNIVVKDKDYIGSDDFLGQIYVSISELADGKILRKVYQLKGENVTAEESFDRGEIEVQMRWLDRTYDDDIEIMQRKKVKAIVLQCWARRLSALFRTRALRQEIADKMVFVRKNATKVTNVCRQRLARKEFRRRLRRHKAAIKIQKRIRVKIARMTVNQKFLERDSATKIQSVGRMYNAKKVLQKLQKERRILLRDSATKIQTLARKMLAVMTMQKLREQRAEDIEAAKKTLQANTELIRRKAQRAAELASSKPKKEERKGKKGKDESAEDAKKKKKKKKKQKKKGAEGEQDAAAEDKPAVEEEEKASEVEKPPEKEEEEELDEEAVQELENLVESEEVAPVAEWIDTYGVDPEFYLKRNRRITERVYRAILDIKYLRLQTRYGQAFVLLYPPEMTVEEEQGVSIRPREDFVSVIWPSADCKYFPREEVIEMYQVSPYEGVLNIHDFVDMVGTVRMVVVQIQCWCRQHIARKERNFLIRIHQAIAKFQKFFRRRNIIIHNAAYRVQSLFYYNSANLLVNLMKLEKKMAIIIQSAFRCWRARIIEMGLRTVDNVYVLKSTESLEEHGPEYLFDRLAYTMWVAKSTTSSVVRVELPKKEAIGSVWIMLSTFEASPKYVSISVVMDKKSREYVPLFQTVPVPRKKGLHWIQFNFKSRISKYFKIEFHENYGDERYISVRQVRFLRSKEKSAEIVKQPEYIIVPVGPRVGEILPVEMRVEAEGWPLPNYQWYRNGRKLPGETSNSIRVNVVSPESKLTRAYRCTVCKNFCRTAPKNAYEIQCLNCANTFDYKEISEYYQLLKSVHETERETEQEILKLKDTRQAMVTSADESLRAMLPAIEEQILVAEETIKELRIERYNIKSIPAHVNRFDGEGVYVCHVTNVRGGSVKIKRKTEPAVCVIERPARYLVKTLPFYTPRKRTRRSRWTIYSSIQGTFTEGKVDGIVTIRYAGGSFYEGPFIPEEAVDVMGEVMPSYRAPNHWGRYIMSDGRIFEGHTVDNHFDPENIQGYYKVTLPGTNETYEGEFVDEKFHGVGLYRYADGSFYEGEWHMNKRYGHGYLSSVEGWVYEGNFDDNKRHGEGLLCWPDGATYLGNFLHNKMHGIGLFVSKMKDVYKGDMENNFFHGKGEMLYNNGSKYTGDFVEGKRHGTGLYIDKHGTEYFGMYQNDLLHGDHVVKKMVLLADEKNVDYEVSLARYSEGAFVEHIGQTVNPASTEQFINLFEEDRRAFDGVYSMLLSRHLPSAPRGIDMANPKVTEILNKIRIEGGHLTGSDALRQARATLERVMPEIKAKRKEIEVAKVDIDHCMKVSREFEEEKIRLMKKFTTSMGIVEDEVQTLEQFWVDDDLERREKFYATVEAMKNVTRDQWFEFKNHRNPPVFVRKIMNCICYLLNMDTDWKKQQGLVSDYIFNSHNGDEDALRHVYDCKLIHMMKTYVVYDYAKPDDEKDLNIAKILADPRFRRDSYYVESIGVAAPYLIDFIKANVVYLRAARELLPKKMATDERRIAAYRLRITHQKLTQDQTSTQNRLTRYRASLKVLTDELEMLQKEMDEAHTTLTFITDSYELGKKAARDLDYYEQLEKKIEAEQTRFAVEASAERLLQGVLDKIAADKLHKKMTEISKGLRDVNYESDEEEEVPKPVIEEWIAEEISIQQNIYVEDGVGLGYSLDPGEAELTVSQLKGVMESCVENLTLRLNEALHEQLETVSWVMPKGRVITQKFLFVLCWKQWKQNANAIEIEKSNQAWMSVWSDEMTCSMMSIQAKVNWRMSALARKQAEIWEKEHPELMKEAERQMAETYAAGKNLNTIASSALKDSTDESEDVNFELKAQALCWAHLHPSEMAVVQDEADMLVAEEFEQHFPDETALNAFQILNNMCEPSLLEWEESAKHWKNFNSDLFAATERNQLTQMAQEFKGEYVFDTDKHCARAVFNGLLAEKMQDEELRQSTHPGQEMLWNARAWSMLNQGVFRKQMKAIRHEMNGKALRLYLDFQDLTENFVKGSYYYTSDEAKQDPSLDRFFGFRKRLENKFAWLHAYCMLRQEELVRDLDNLQNEDPALKTFHNVRPSKRKKVEYVAEKKYQNERTKLEEELQEVVERLGIWNTYFGPPQVVKESWE